MKKIYLYNKILKWKRYEMRYDSDKSGVTNENQCRSKHLDNNAPNWRLSTQVLYAGKHQVLISTFDVEAIRQNEKKRVVKNLMQQCNNCLNKEISENVMECVTIATLLRLNE